MAKFSSDNQPVNRPPRGNGWRGKILDALKAQGKSEEDFIAYIVQRSLDPDDALSPKLLDLIVSRLSPLDKAVLPKVKIDLGNAQTPADKIDAIITAVASEEVPADVAAMIVQMIKTGIDVRELTELAQRLETLEKLIQEKSKQD